MEDELAQLTICRLTVQDQVVLLPLASDKTRRKQRTKTCEPRREKERETERSWVQLDLCNLPVI